MSAHVRVPATHEWTTAGGANRILDEGIAKGNRIRTYQGIQIWGDCSRITQVTKHIAAPLVGIENDNIWRFIRHNNNKV